MPTLQALDNQINPGVDLDDAACEEETLARLVDEIIAVARRLFEGTLQDPVQTRRVVRVSR